MSFDLKRFFTKSYTFRSLYWLFVLNWIDLSVMLSNRPSDSSARKRVVFVKMDGIGDFVIWSTLFDQIKQLFPSHEFERILVGNDRFKGLADEELAFDQKIFVNLDKFATSPIYRRSILRIVRMLVPDVIFNARTTRDLLWSDSIVRCSGADKKIGSEGIGNIMNPLQEKITRRWYTELRPAPRPKDHELISNMRFLGLPEADVSVSGALKSFENAKSPVTGDYAVIFVGAQSGEKCWPARKFGEAANAIVELFDMKVVLCGGPDEEHLAEQFRKGFKSQAIELIGPSATSLNELVALINNSRIIVSNDTGAAHIAAISGRPTVVIAPGNQAGRYFPYPIELSLKYLGVIQHTGLCVRCNEHCVKTWGTSLETRPCLTEISVDEVVDAASHFLEVSFKKKNSLSEDV